MCWYIQHLLVEYPGLPSNLHVLHFEGPTTRESIDSRP